MAHDDSERLAEVQRRLSEIQREKGGRIRWQITKRTAEMAIRALEGGKAPASRAAKPRRRKRHKRLL